MTQWAGFTCFVKDARGNVDVGATIDRDSFLKHFADVILSSQPLRDIALESRALIEVSNDEPQDD